MRTAAEAIADAIRNKPDALFCFAAGETPLPIFSALIEMQKQGTVDLGSVYYVGLDEWIGLGRETEGSCAQMMFDGYYLQAGIAPERICAWDGHCADVEAESARVEAWINTHGGLYLALLGIGINGHVGFNEPFADLTARTIRVPLDDTTKKVSAKYFKEAQAVEYGVSIGVAELKTAQKLLLIATGARKAEIIKKVVKGGYSEAIPASVLGDHPDITLYADTDAASVL